MISRERFINQFIEMTQIYSPSKNEKAMCDYIEDYLTKRGISFKSDNAGAAYGGNGRNIVAYIPGTQEGLPIGFCAHLDQIEPCEHVHAIVEGDTIRTDGTTTLGGDDKGGVAVILEALEDVLETNAPHRDIYLVFTVSEEIGMFGVMNMDLSILPCKDLVVVDDASGTADVVVYKAPALDWIHATMHGKKAHAGIEPEKGISAVTAVAKAIAKMHLGRLDSETTANIGRIEGGSETNIVTDEVKFEAEVRSHSMEKLREEVAHMKKCCDDAAAEMGTTCDFQHELNFPTLSLDLEGELAQITMNAMRAEGIEPYLKVIGGGSDANILDGFGYRSVITGAGMRNVHTVEETLDLAEAMKAIRFLRRMMSVE